MSAAMTKEERERLIAHTLNGCVMAGCDRCKKIAAELRRTADYDELREKNVAAMQSLAEWDDRVAQLQARCEAAERRLRYLNETEAYIAHSKDGDDCWLMVPDEEGNYEREGGSFDSHEKAIDAALSPTDADVTK